MSAEMKAWALLVASAQAGEPRIYLDPTAKPDLERLAERDLIDFIDFGDKIVAWLTPAGERKAFPARRVEVTTFGDPGPRFMSAHDPRVSDREPLDAQSIIDRAKSVGHLPNSEESVFLKEWFESNQRGGEPPAIDWRTRFAAWVAAHLVPAVFAWGFAAGAVFMAALMVVFP